MTVRTLALLSVCLLSAPALAGCLGDDSTVPAAPTPVEDTSTTAPTPLPTPEPEPVPEPAARFVFQGFEAAPSEVGVGDNVTITATVVNVGDAAGTALIIPMWSGIDSPGAQEIDMVAGRERVLNFNVEARSVGNHDVGLRIVGHEKKTAPVTVTAPDPFIADWSIANPLCEKRLQMTAKVGNRGGSPTDELKLDVYSVDGDGKTWGHATFTVPPVARDATHSVADNLYAPFDCADEGVRFTLLFIVKKDDAEQFRFQTDPFRPVTT